MDFSKEYVKIPYDLSGATSKNRFRLEMLWGASKMFDIFDKDEFCVVFDYKCDIEIHFTESLELYQLKTHKVQKPYNFSIISKQDKSGKSIFGKLYLLRNGLDKSASVKLAIVSNAFLKINKTTFSDSEIVHFDDLDTTVKKEVCNALRKELGNNLDFTDIDFIYTSMNLLNPENDLKGKIVGSFEKIMGCEPEKPNALYRLIRDTVESKACYEMKCDDYTELKKNKGITKKELYNMLAQHSTQINTAVENVERYISKNITSPKEIRQFKASLVTITKDYLVSFELKENEKKIAAFLNEHEDDLPDNLIDTLNELFDIFGNRFSIEYSNTDRKVFLLIVLFKWEDGKYE